MLAVFDVLEDSGKSGGGRKGKEGKDAGLSHAEEILVTKSDLEEKQKVMQELKQKVDELTLHNEYVEKERGEVNRYDPTRVCCVLYAVLCVVCCVVYAVLCTVLHTNTQV